ncbi:polysaccharide deacetylase family protein [Streptomyces sp. NPDC127084]|uniref:polysaccharide deacetylase family protein n=1 Tax=Streptomyces sp. NPDC127084 TaxID=3347133 RepID=UPI003669D08D
MVRPGHRPGPPAHSAAAFAALAVAAWHIGPAATWLPPVRAALGAVRPFVPGAGPVVGLDGRGHPGRVALTFDDGPDPATTPYFLLALEQLAVHATFFVLGERLARHPGLGQRIAAEGHELAVHGWRHGRPWTPRPGRDARDVLRTATLVRRVSGTYPRWYRPPYGILTGGRLTAARRAGLSTVLWSDWGRDWTAQATAESVFAEATQGLRGGATVLLHDTDACGAPGCWRAALGALPALVAACRNRGLTVGRLAEHGLPAEVNRDAGTLAL